jgi:pimeloyl-ACP methyl ester carboxylesterase
MTMSAEKPDKEIRLSAGTIRYRDVGTGPVLLFVHGLLVNGTLWTPLVERLRADHRCIVPDLPLGSHSVPMNPDAELDPLAVADLMAEMIDALELEDVTLVGNDSGGAISQMVATRHPGKVGRLILTNCDTYEDFPPALFKYLLVAARIPGALRGLGQSLRFKPLRRSPIAYGVLTKSRLSDEQLEDWVRPGIDSAEIGRDTRKFLRGASGKQTMEAARKLADFQAPTLFAWAEEDRWFKLADAERLAASMPNATVERIADSKTFVSLDQPQRLAEIITSFVRETKPVAA